MDAEIIAIGSEMLTPFRQDTNSLYVTERLNQLGVEVIFKTIVGDSRERLTGAACLALSRADIVIFMGGLGPTEDDLTREAVADALQLELRRDPEIVASLERRFAARGYKMTANNSKQADVIAGATVLQNANGSAPGQWLTGKYEGKEKIIILLPGPPHELTALFEEQCMDRLRAKVPPQFIVTRVLKIAMIAESQCDARIAPIYKRYTDVQTTILAGAGEIQLHLKTRGTSLEVAQQHVDQLAEELEEELDEFVYTSMSGSSRYFLGGAVVYSNELKTKFAGVPTELIEKHGAVSREVAIALAEGIRERCGATFGIGITGVAGPTGGSAEKPVGLVFHALAGARGTEVVQRNFPGDRQRVRWFATTQALDMVRRKLM